VGCSDALNVRRVSRLIKRRFPALQDWE